MFPTRDYPFPPSLGSGVRGETSGLGDQSLPKDLSHRSDFSLPESPTLNSFVLISNSPFRFPPSDGEEGRSRTTNYDPHGSVEERAFEFRSVYLCLPPSLSRRNKYPGHCPGEDRVSVIRWSAFSVG